MEIITDEENQVKTKQMTLLNSFGSNILQKQAKMIKY